MMPAAFHLPAGATMEQTMEALQRAQALEIELAGELGEDGMYRRLRECLVELVTAYQEAVTDIPDVGRIAAAERAVEEEMASLFMTLGAMSAGE